MGCNGCGDSELQYLLDAEARRDFFISLASNIATVIVIWLLFRGKLRPGG